MTTTNDLVQQDDSDDVTDAGQRSESGTDDTEPQQGEPGDQTDDGDQTDGDRTEAKLRKRAQRAEQERDELRALLDHQRHALVEAACTNAGLTERHARAAELTVDSVLTEDGLVDFNRLSESIGAAVAEFGITQRRRPAPNAQQGAGGGPARSRASWASALKE